MTSNFPLSQSPLSNIRPDLQAIADMIPPKSRVLDLGCGDGELLAYLVVNRQVKGRGIELGEENVLACVGKGLSVRQGNLNEGLADYPNGSFDYVILSQTLPFLNDPAKIIQEALRVGQNAIVSFPNWGYWRCRLELLLSGRMPRPADLPRYWYIAPRMQAFTVSDFADYCHQLGVKIDQQIYLNHGRRIGEVQFKNLLSTTAVFTLNKS